MNTIYKLKSQNNWFKDTFGSSIRTLSHEKISVSTPRYVKSFLNRTNTKSNNLVFVMNKTAYLQKSLDKIRIKKSEAENKRQFLFERKKRVLRIRETHQKIEKKFEVAAIKIQKWVRGFLIKYFVSILNNY